MEAMEVKVRGGQREKESWTWRRTKTGQRRGPVRRRVSDDIRATLVDHVINHGLSMREAGQRVHPNLSRYTVASIIRTWRLENRNSKYSSRFRPWRMTRERPEACSQPSSSSSSSLVIVATDLYPYIVPLLPPHCH
ncbi:hypothetical protein QQF64_020467 [Cirrhinus molitorella]|uniref:Transposase Tc1-like domain-containing protein n=1 Tax=Cirrhinus molitorella TaxID=172907 RepID=A0ABR3LCT5_9TELE